MYARILELSFAKSLRKMYVKLIHNVFITIFDIYMNVLNGVES